MSSSSRIVRVAGAVRLAVRVTRILFTTSERDDIQELQLADADSTAEQIRQHIFARRFFVDDDDD